MKTVLTVEEEKEKKERDMLNNIESVRYTDRIKIELREWEGDLIAEELC